MPGRREFSRKRLVQAACGPDMAFLQRGCELDMHFLQGGCRPDMAFLQERVDGKTDSRDL